MIEVDREEGLSALTFSDARFRQKHSAPQPFTLALSDAARAQSEQLAGACESFPAREWEGGGQ
jgi:hypothetical protein